MKKFLRVFVSLVLIFTASMSGIFYVMSDSKAFKITNKDGEITRVTDKTKDIEVLVLGVDAEDNEEAKNSRTDTMMVLKYYAKTNTIKGISIPRDTKAEIEGHGEEKINHAHAYGGPELSIETVNKLLGTNIDYYVRVNYKVVKEVVDTIGGVEVDVPMDMNYEDPYASPPLSINLKEGVQKLDGDKALQFLRFRKGYADQDMGRINAQQTFISALLDEMVSPKNITKVPGMIKDIFNNIDTNLSMSEMLSYTKDLNKLSAKKMQLVVLEGEYTMEGGVSYLLTDDEEIAKVMEIYNSDKVKEVQTGESKEGTEELE